MKTLGYPMTWPTSCFIGSNNVGCGAATFAHTNGEGDFVLFDRLGPPWPIHQCYLDRAALFPASTRWTLSVQLQPPKPKKVWKSASDIQRAEPASFFSTPLYVVGYLQEHHLQKRNQWLEKEKIGTLGRKAILKVLDKYPDQFTLVSGDPDAGLQSFTAFGDFSKLRLRKKDMIRATLRAVNIVLHKTRPFVFVADDISVLRGQLRGGFSTT